MMLSHLPTRVSHVRLLPQLSPHLILATKSLFDRNAPIMSTFDRCHTCFLLQAFMAGMCGFQKHGKNIALHGIRPGIDRVGLSDYRKQLRFPALLPPLPIPASWLRLSFMNNSISTDIYVTVLLFFLCFLSRLLGC